jgi:hypothetical protein
MCFPYVEAVYWVVAVIASGLLGWHALEIFSVPRVNEPNLWQQRFLNFVGSMFGWLVLWPLTLRYLPCVSSTGCPELHFGWWDVLACFVAFIGVTGYLPFTVIGAITAVFGSLRSLAQIVASWLKP